jgi:hypothetical protein
MSATRLSSESLQQFQAILNIYRDKINPEKQKSQRDSFILRLLNNESGRERLKKFDNYVAKITVNGAETSEDRMTFLKRISAFAYAEYSDSWTKQNDGLCASVLRFVADEVGVQRKKLPAMHPGNYGAPAYFYAEPEADTDFFKRVNETLNPLQPKVQEKHVPAVCYSYSHNVVARPGYPVPSNSIKQDDEYVSNIVRAGIPVIRK